MTVRTLIARIREEPEWVILGVLALIILVGGGTYLYGSAFESATRAQSQFNSVYARYQQAIRTENYEPVVRGFNQIVSEYPNASVTDKALFFLGKVHMKQENYLEAMQQFQQLRDQHPNSFFYDSTLLNMAYCASQRENYQQALSFLNNLLDRVDEGPLWEEAMWQKAMVLAELDNTDRAISSLDQLVDRTGGEDSFWKERARQFKSLLQS
jgi:outer membrane protein assembly factor BamD (BamD/ComL family)